ncbi:NUDIX hydrolase [Sphingobium sp. EM0848]|uniref:NUDIX hydrolase n=1 Tax=Sphingobium sp. EM0848 TaxID=2743473 RepID=UPI00159C82D5|nr:NUDIX hydrolase [Sphingobium sp. EM0848]
MNEQKSVCAATNRMRTLIQIVALYQSAAIPYRHNSSGALEVLLVSSRRSGRWVLPKGANKRGLRPYQSAAREAFEEAGALGVISAFEIGTYRQHKIQRNGNSVPIYVTAYPLSVQSVLQSWPEMSLRRRRWMTIGDAAIAVRDTEISAVLHAFGEAYSFDGLV